MDTPLVERALRLLGERLAYHREVELLLVGGAAGMLTGLLPPSRTTADCDVMALVPQEAALAVHCAAGQVGQELDLPSTWLNSDVQLLRHALPTGWKTRRVWVGTWGLLRVFAVSRVDLIAMKILAGRAQDLEDIRAMKVRTDDVEFVQEHLRALAAQGIPDAHIEDARLVLNTLEVRSHE